MAYGYAATDAYDSATPFFGSEPGNCARFRSFDPASGTYLGFDGVRHSCR
jgi:hypothetical protein